ncbi:MAG: hypothetical protein A3F18_08220 [Legionellales bacterium RIFCSPHIGHO2_12_FULL_37_14]|nr:MAG: hypothetical protein A3F18_08220 [Legionellales bacterium RIFCSPHIGHO2_12_FULL_37_14]
MQTDLALTQQLIKLLKKHKFKVATAESCTGGMLAALLTTYSGSSTWFERGWVTYSNAAKIAELNVAEALINKHGAVSAEVASKMAEGALTASYADLSIAITGIAGPSGGTQEKPVGLVYFAFSMPDKPTSTICKNLTGSRSQIRFMACCEALQGAIDKFKV